MKLTKKQISLIGLLIVAVLGALGFDMSAFTGEQQNNNNAKEYKTNNTGTQQAQYQRQNDSYKKKSTAATNKGDFDYYALVMTWSPTYCQDNAGDRRAAAQCNGRRPYAFVLHGLWPQYNKGFPENCQVRDNWVPKDVINSMLDIMPAKGLIIHEWKKHGTCTGLDARGYYDASRKAYKSVNVPNRFQSPKAPIYTSPQQLETAFLKANPQLTEDMLVITCGKKRRLREIRVCLTKDLKPTNCGQNENQRRLCRQKQIILPPVR